MNVIVTGFGERCNLVREGKTFVKDEAKIPVETYYFRIYWTELHQIFMICTHMGGHNQSDFIFAITQGTLL